MSIENIVLSRDHRGISALRPYLAPDFCERAASFILERLGTVVIATGFYIPAGSAPETDGPPGAIALGRVLAGLGSHVNYLTDAYTAPLLRALAGPGAQVLEFPFADHQESWLHAADLVRTVAPTLTIAIERCGLTGEGLYRNMRGVDVSGYHAKIDYVFRTHEASVGIGDGGNEIGMGNLAAAIPMVMPMAGPPCATTTTRLVISSVSNWGAWGIIAALSRLRGREPAAGRPRGARPRGPDRGARRGGRHDRPADRERGRVLARGERSRAGRDAHLARPIRRRANPKGSAYKRRGCKGSAYKRWAYSCRARL